MGTTRDLSSMQPTEKPRRIVIKVRLTPVAYRWLRDQAEAQALTKSAVLEQIIRDLDKKDDTNG